MKRLGVDPGSGVLDPKEPILMAVSCDAFAYGQEVPCPLLTPTQTWFNSTSGDLLLLF